MHSGVIARPGGLPWEWFKVERHGIHVTTTRLVMDLRGLMIMRVCLLNRGVVTSHSQLLAPVELKRSRRSQI